MMKTLPLLLASLFCFTLTSVASSQSSWVKDMTEAIRLGDEKGLDLLVRRDAQSCLAHFEGLAFDALTKPDDERISTRIAALKESWTRVYKSELLERYDRWVQRLTNRTSIAFRQGQQAMNRATTEHQRLRSSRNRNRGAWEDLRDTMMNVVRSFESVGNSLEAARSWSMLAMIHNELPDSTFDDQRDGLSAIQQFLSHRQNWDWTTDDTYKTNANASKVGKAQITAAKDARKQREAEGYDVNVRGAEAFLVPNADEVEVVSELKFKALAKNKLDMSWQGGSTPLSWPRIDVAAKDAKHFDWFKGSELYMVRPSANSYGVSIDGKSEGRSFVEASAANRVKKPTKFFLDDSRKHPYAMWFFLGAQQELYQGFNQNLAPTQERASVYYKSAASWTTEIAGEKVVFYDDNTNGKLFEDDPYDYGLRDFTAGVDMKDEVRLPTMDGMKIGSGVIGPFSTWVKLGDSWYHIRGKKQNSSVGARPASPAYFKTGTIQLKWTGSRSTKPKVLVVAGDGSFKSARFNIANGKPVEVPVGSYHIEFGRVEQGKGARVISANILPGTSEDVVIEEGANTELVMGGPFKLDFTRGGEGGEVSISAFSLKVVGVSGAVYTHINGAAPAPEVVATKNPDGKGAKLVGTFVNITDLDTLVSIADNKKYRKVNVSAGFFPIVKGSGDGTPILEFSVPEGTLVGMRQKKNKLFGKLAPIFK